MHFVVSRTTSYREPAHDRRTRDPRIRWAALFVCLLFLCLWVRLFYIMVWQHGFYAALAEDTHEVLAKLTPKRGEIFWQDSRTNETYPLALNRDYYLVFADTRLIEDDKTAKDIANALTPMFSYPDDKKAQLVTALSKRTDPYEPIELKVEEKVADQIRNLHLTGIGLIKQPHRYYPEKELGGHIVGFLGKNSDGRDVGQYGIEGYWQETLAGTGGVFEGLRSAGGRWIPQAGKAYEPPKDGPALVLTLDRTLQFKACDILKRAAKEYEATSASLIIMDPKTGAIRAMCSVPDFDPNEYGKVESSDAFNNRTIFAPYEPGSVFKPLTMAAAIDEELVTPHTLFTDTGSREVGCSKAIQNANFRSYGVQTMTGVLENSINTGISFVVEKLGKKRFREYVEKFGFGAKEGIELDTEVAGNIASLSEGKQDGMDCYTATGAFGQGITVTPLQMINAISVIANGGTLMKPYIVEKIIHANGTVETVQPKEIRRVISQRAASLVSGMMTSVVDNGQAKVARIPGYYVAGKTGTAQIPGPGGYSEDTNHTFVGYVPADNPKFAMIVKFEKPARKFADSTAAPTFAEIAKFALDYYHVPPER